MKFSRYFYNIFNVFATAKKIREDDERRQKSIRFAISAIIYSLLMVVCAFFGVFLLSLNDTGILYIFIVIIAAAFLITVIIEFIGALLRVIAQFTLNKKTASWVALVIFIASFIGTVVIFVHYLG